MRHHLLSVDPGLRSCGCAVWRDGHLLGAKLVVGVNSADALLADVVEQMVFQVKKWLNTFNCGFDVVAIELPQTYGGRAAKGDANDLIHLALVVGGIHVHLGYPTMLLRPAEWKGQVPKKNRHGENVIEERCKEKLDAAELLLVELPRAKSLQHNVFDALGIGLHVLDR